MGDVFSVSADGSVLSAYLDLRGGATGACDVVVANGTASPATDPGVFATLVGPLTFLPRMPISK